MVKSKGKRVRRWLWIGVLGVAIAGIGYAFLRPKGKPEEEKNKIKTAKAEVADVQVRVTEVGSVEPLVKVDVKSALSGKVVELLVREGDAVRKGQVLARVEPDVNQARDLAQVKNSVHEAEIGLTEAKSTHERNQGLLGQGLLSAQAGLESETRFRQAKASYDAAMDKYRIVEESGVPIAVATAGTLQRLNVTSPMDGVVIRRPVELGDTVMSGVSSFNAGTVLMTVADVETMIIKAGVNEVDIGKVRLEQPVKVSLDAYPKVRFAGAIKRIAPAARLEEKVKVFDVEIAIDRQGAELRTGMTANIDIVGEKRAKVLTVPVEAIFKKDEAEVVYLRKPEEPKKAAETGGLIASVFAAGKKDVPAKLDPKEAWKEKFEVKEIETGLAAVDKVEVVKGLAAGMEVAVEDPTRPKEKKDNE
ncbi:MAG TPA: efflux RND transporter periplasmic adaptor subunit [Vicinamibacteria bacterium]|nr:efflux RND transporter periplasmic adaptor subunit [Vicinamibacteria bacterium]